VTGSDAKGEAFGITAPLAGWCSALKPTNQSKTVGFIRTELPANGLALITERKLGKGAVVVIGAQPQGDAGQEMLAKLVAHYADQAGITQRFHASKGTLVCPRITEDGHKLWIVVNMDGKGGKVELPQSAEDALGGEKLSAGTIELRRYEYRVFRF